MTGVHALCAAFPGATRTYPFGEGTAVYKVGGKMFALTQDDPVSINLKAEPPDVTGLVETYDAVTRGFHMNKKHLLGELIEDSYDLVVDTLPARNRP
jgi:predicted DNA-binding protein (MmcQ/YjbR family)